MIYQKIVKIMEELSPKGKIRREDITSVMQPLLSKYKLVIRPSEVSDYRFANQEACFKIRYEIIDAEDEQLRAIYTEVPGGGVDNEGKGRATYMASTGAYRQALQQLFAIQIVDELAQGNIVGSNQENNQQGFSPFQVFAENKPNTTNSNVQSQNTNVQNTRNTQPVEIEEITENYLDSEFAEFYSGEAVA